MEVHRSTSGAALGLGLGSELAQLANVAALAIPALGIVIVDPLMSLVDTACIGRTSSLQLAALAPNSAVFNMIFQVRPVELSEPACLGLPALANSGLSLLSVSLFYGPSCKHKASFLFVCTSNSLNLVALEAAPSLTRLSRTHHAHTQLSSQHRNTRCTVHSCVLSLSTLGRPCVLDPCGKSPAAVFSAHPRRSPPHVCRCSPLSECPSPTCSRATPPTPPPSPTLR